MNKTFAIISVKKRKTRHGYQLVATGTNGQRYLSGGNNPPIEMLEKNSICLGGRHWRLFSMLDDKNRLELLNFFKSNLNDSNKH